MSDEKCPICDREYIHKLDVDPRIRNPTVRHDFSVCKQPHYDEIERWYIHDPTNSIVTHKKRENKKGILHRMFIDTEEED